jgi:hypothetical protein
VSGDTPDYDYHRAHAKAVAARHRLAQAAAVNPAPVDLRTGHFAPPNQHAVWHLPLSSGNVVQVVWHEHGDVVGCRIVPMEVDH